MKTTLAELLNPDFSHYRSIGELARTLQSFLSTAHSFRDKGRWGDSGPSEVLCNYGGCTGSATQEWHSGRIVSQCRHYDVTTWQQNHDAIYNCILGALCGRSPSFERWRKSHLIHLHMPLKFPMAYQHCGEEQKAWPTFMALHKFQLAVPTLNSCHKRVNVLAAPELIVDRESVELKVCVTDKQELRGSPSYSRWDFSFLTDEPNPRWRCQRETFAAFLLRGTEYFKNYRLTPPRVKRQEERFGVTAKSGSQA